MSTPLPIPEIEREIIEEFRFLGDWTERYGYLIDLGKALPPLNEQYHTEPYRVHGCQSQVWLHSTLDEGRVHYEADSDAMITKGLIALLMRVLSDQPVEAIVEADLTFIDEIGMRQHLSPNRSNGLNAMVKRMKADAHALTNSLQPKA